jgi:hypothetical protein
MTLQTGAVDNIMFGPDYTLGACPGCTSLGDRRGGAGATRGDWVSGFAAGKSVNVEGVESSTGKPAESRVGTEGEFSTPAPWPP